MSEEITPEELLSIINQAAREGATELDLSSKGITELPESIGKLQSLLRLNLNYNNLTNLPESIGNLQNLQGLYLNNNHLTSLPETIGDLQNLQSLSLRNDLASLPVSIGDLQSLRSLDLGYNLLTSVPESIGYLQNLTGLALNTNKLKSLPESIGDLQNLQELFINFNQLTNLPESIGKLERLEILILVSNQLKSLPRSIGNLQNLRGLFIDQNPLNPELAAANKQGFDALQVYLRGRATDTVEGIEVLDEFEGVLAGPRSVSCVACQVHITVGRPGRFRCPACKADSCIGEDGSVTLVKGADRTFADPQVPAEDEFLSLLKQLKGSRGEQRASASGNLGLLGDRRATAVLIESLIDEDPGNQDMAAQVLMELYGNDVAPFIQALEHSDRMIRRAGARWLRTLREEAYANPKDPAGRQNAYRLLDNRAHLAIPVIAEAAMDGDVFVRREALTWLALLDHPRGNAAQKQALKDQDRESRVIASQAQRQ